ncbi:MAG: hypothetical protein HC767_07995 [Akkermansiaceae bacterium]|nr:hypothetical protein [Akkermansiaceae bacterium]
MLAKGQRLTEILKQDQYTPLPMEKQVIIIFAAINGYLDAHPVDQGLRYEKELYTWLDMKHPALVAEIAEKKDLGGALGEKLKAALTEFGGVFQPTAH